MKRQRNLECTLLSLKIQSKKATYCTIQFVTFGKGQNFRDNKKISDFQTLGRMEKWISRTQRIFMKLFFRILQWWIHAIIYLCKGIECTPRRVNPNLNYRFGVILIWGDYDVDVCSSVVTNVWLWWKMLIMGGRYAYVEAENMWEISVAASQFCYKPKNYLKVKVLKNKQKIDP